MRQSDTPLAAGAAIDAVRERLVAELPARAALGLAGRPEQLAAVLAAAPHPDLAAAEAAASLAAELCGAGPLDRLFADPTVTEIMVSGPHSVHVEVEGRLARADVRFRDSHHLRAVVERLVATAGRRIDESAPTVDAVMPDGSRLNAVLPPVAVGGPHLTIRRPRALALQLPDMVRDGSIPRPVAAFLHAAVAGRCNLLVSGGAGAGKTTLLAALCALVPHDQRIVTIEDVAELCIDHPHVAAQQCRDSASTTLASVDMRALVRNTLRMRPDRIVVGEVRGAEAADMIAAMNTGHAGSMSTVHANSAVDAMTRIEAMLAMAWPNQSMLTLRAWVSGAVDVMVHCERDSAGRRTVTQVLTSGESAAEMVYDATSPDPPLLRRPSDRCLERMARHGVVFRPELLTRPHVA